MRNVYLHIGSSKTGSSALQTYLTFNYSLPHPAANKHFVYCCLLQNGEIAFGEERKAQAQKNILGYASSIPKLTDRTDLSVTKAGLDQIFAAGLTPIFSQEAWFHEAGNFAEHDFFSVLDVRAHIIAYVRPQVEWFNSAWWQWFAWGESVQKPE